MIRISRLALVVALFSLVGFGCSDGPESLTQSPEGRTPSQLASALSIPWGSTLVSAKLSVYLLNDPNATVNAHRITSPWAEMSVTWGNFGNAYDATVLDSFVSDGLGWRTVDVTGTVQAWMDGTYENYGFLLKQGLVDATVYNSSEVATVEVRPKLELCYTTATGTECIVIQRGTFGEVADSYIWATAQNDNNGSATILFTGLVGGFEKLTLLRFDMEDQPPEPASIGDFVWLDDDNDGIQDAGEVGFPDAEVMLYDCDGNYIATTMTDANGYYLFDNLPPGDYHIEFVLPEGYVFSPQNQGTDGAVDSDPNAAGVAACTTLYPGEHDPTWDAGLYMPEWEGCSLTIGFWKTHAGFGPQADVVTPLLPISLGAIDVTNATEAHDILVQKYCGGPSNGLVKLTAQFLGVMLNGANGADLGAVADEIADAHQYLTDYSCEDWWTGELSRSQKKMINSLKSTFDDYNNGLIGPGHCDDFGDDD